MLAVLGIKTFAKAELTDKKNSNFRFQLNYNIFFERERQNGIVNEPTSVL
jgi:hypothetical protein